MTDRPLPDQHEHEERVWRAAMEHVLAVRAGAADPAARAAAECWRRADPAHDAAYREAENVWRIAGALPPVHADRWARIRRPRITRRQLIAGGGALAAGIAGLTVLPQLRERIEGGERTGSGETRRLHLADGSRVTLGPESHLRIKFDERSRSVALARGVAYFEVARDAARPFTVTSDGVTARVLGTAFEVRNRDGDLSIAVSRGRVEVSSDRPPALPAERLGAGDRLALRRGEGMVERSEAAPDRIAAWRDGMVVVERRSVRAVVEEIAPWYAGRIVILDSDLAVRQVSGVYDLRDPVAALEAAVGPFGGRVRRVTPWLILLSAGE